MVLLYGVAMHRESQMIGATADLDYFLGKQLLNGWKNRDFKHGKSRRNNRMVTPPPDLLVPPGGPDTL
jgi:hypothetical protein